MKNDVDELRKKVEELEKRVKKLEKEADIPVYNDPKQDDILLSEAIALTKPQNLISASYLQRRLSVGYARAARILDQLEKLGVIDSGEGAKPRKVLINKVNE